MSYTPFNAPLLSPLLGDADIAANFSVKADVECMLQFEAALAKSQAEVGLISDSAALMIGSVCSEFEPDIGKLRAGVERDGMAVPEFVRQLREASGDAGEFVHFGSTSQDVIDTSLVLRLVKVNSVLEERLASVLETLEQLITRFGDREFTGHTRMQEALPIKARHRLWQWSDPLKAQATALTGITDNLHVVQLGGPVGDLQTMEDKGEEVRGRLAFNTGLGDPGRSWHTDRTCLVQYCNWLSLTCSHLGKIGQDFALMALLKNGELEFDSAGGSSAMSHKQNPIKAETLVSQAEFASLLASGMQHASLHEQERSGSAWTLEWMIIPQVTVVTGSALTNANALLGSIRSFGK